MAATSNDSGSALQALQRCGARPQAEGQHHRYLQSRDVTPDIHDDSLTVLHDVDDLASSVTPVQIPKGLGCLSQRIRSADERSNPSGLDSLLESDQVVLVRCRDERAFLLAHEQRARAGSREVVEMVADLRNQPPFDSAGTDDELLKARDGCVSPRTRRWPGASR
jgi:hypothetical protein